MHHAEIYVFNIYHGKEGKWHLLFMPDQQVSPLCIQ